MTVDKYHYTNIAANGTITLFRGKGTLRSITINTKGASSNTITVYDSASGSGNKVAIIDTTSLQGTFFYDAYLMNGLTIVTATGTPADITVTFMI